MSEVLKSPTYRKLPLGCTASDCGCPPAVANGLPGAGVRAPDVGSIAYTETLLLPALATKAYLPWGSTATAQGLVPASNGLPGTSLRVPSDAIAKTDTLLEPS